MTGHFCDNRILDGQNIKFGWSCLLTGRYFDPWIKTPKLINTQVKFNNFTIFMNSFIWRHYYFEEMSKCFVSFVDDLDGLTSKVMKIKKCNCFMNSNNHEAKNYHNQHFSTDTVKWKRIFFLLENTFIAMFKWCKQLYYVSPPTLSMWYEYQTKILKTEKRKKEIGPDVFHHRKCRNF